MIDLPPSLTEHEQVESLAYRLYEDEGKPEGRADEHWAQAEQFIHAERLAIASSSEKSDIIQVGGLGLILVILLILLLMGREERTSCRRLRVRAGAARAVGQNRIRQSRLHR